MLSGLINLIVVTLYDAELNGGFELVEEIIDEHSLVTVKKMGNILDVQYSEHMNLQARIKVLSGHRYMVLATGEILDFSHSVNRSQNAKSLRKTFKRLRDRINSNFSGSANELFITLTFDRKLGKRPFLSDTDYMASVYLGFVRRLKRAYGPSLIFIKVIEPHADGHAHMHVLIKFPEVSKIFINNLELRKYWLWGNVQIHGIRNNTNVGAYLTAYLTDVELDQTALAAMVAQGRLGCKIDIVDRAGKKYIKGGRLHYYPRDFHLFTCSRNAKFPDVSRTTKKSIKKELSAATLNFSKQYDVKVGNFSNVLRVESYRLPF